MNKLFCRDNLDVSRRSVRDETIGFCCIELLFNSKGNYNQIHNNIGEKDR